MFYHLPYSKGTLVHELNLFFNLGNDGCVCVYEGKMAMVVLVTQDRVYKQKQNCFHFYLQPNCLQIKAFMNQSTTV